MLNKNIANGNVRWFFFISTPRVEEDDEEEEEDKNKHHKLKMIWNLFFASFKVHV